MSASAAAPPLPPRSGEGEGRERAARRLRNPEHRSQRPRQMPRLPNRRLRPLPTLSLSRCARGRGGSGRRPFAAARVQDRTANAVPVGEHFGVPESQHPPTRPLKESCSPGVIVELVGMLAAIHLDDEPGVDAGEVEKEGAEGQLPLPLPTPEPMRSKRAPQIKFGAGGVAAQFAGAGDLRGLGKSSHVTHRVDVNICGTFVQAGTHAPPSPYPLSLSLRSGERR